MLPEEFSHLYDGVIPHSYLGTTCDCNGGSQAIEQCPHLQDGEFASFLRSIPARIALIEKDEENADQLKTDLYYKVIERLSYSHGCKFAMT